MRDLFLRTGKHPELRADEVVWLDTSYDYDHRCVTVVNDEDFTRDKEEKLIIRRQNRRAKHERRRDQ